MYVVFFATSLAHRSPPNLSAKTGVSVKTPFALQPAPGLWHFWPHVEVQLCLSLAAETVFKLWNWHCCKGCLALAKWLATNPSISVRWMNAQAFLLAKMPMVSPEPSQWPPRNSVTDHPAHDPRATAKQKTPLSRIYLSVSSHCYFACHLEAFSLLWLAQPLNKVLGFCSRWGCSLRAIH